MKSKIITGCIMALFAIAAIAAPYVPPKVWVAGDPILSSDFNTMNSTLANSINNITAAQITDSTITSGKLASGAIGRNAIAVGAIGTNQIDSGAIRFDTQFHPSWTVATNRFVSSTDTTNNFTKTISGYFYGDNSDTRVIYNTVQRTGSMAAQGVNIPFTVTRVTIDAAVVGAGSHVVISDVLSDSGIMINDGGAPGNTFIAHTDSPIYTWSAGNYPALYNTADSHGFRVKYNATYNSNVSGKLYMWTASGY